MARARVPSTVPGRWLAATLLAALAAACAPNREGAEPRPTGCYQFERGEGARALGLPWGVEITDAPLEGRWPLVERFDDVGRAATATSPTGRADHPFGYWRPLPGDSIELGHPGGGGLVLRLERRGRDLVGLGRAAGDALPPGETPGPRDAHPVVARRVLCGAT